MNCIICSGVPSGSGGTFGIAWAAPGASATAPGCRAIRSVAEPTNSPAAIVNRATVGAEKKRERTWDMKASGKR